MFILKFDEFRPKSINIINESVKSFTVEISRVNFGFRSEAYKYARRLGLYIDIKESEKGPTLGRRLWEPGYLMVRYIVTVDGDDYNVQKFLRWIKSYFDTGIIGIKK